MSLRAIYFYSIILRDPVICIKPATCPRIYFLGDLNSKIVSSIPEYS